MLLLLAALLAAPTEGFLDRNAARPGVRTIEQGVQYRVLTAGPPGGASPRLSNEITIHYEGRLLTGAVFDSSFERGEPATFPLGRLVPCWKLALPRMKVGDEWMVFCPSETAYGKKGAGGVIPPDAVLAFRIKLIGVGEASPK